MWQRTHIKVQSPHDPNIKRGLLNISYSENNLGTHEIQHTQWQDSNYTNDYTYNFICLFVQTSWAKWMYWQQQGKFVKYTIHNLGPCISILPHFYRLNYKCNTCHHKQTAHTFSQLLRHTTLALPEKGLKDFSSFKTSQALLPTNHEFHRPGLGCHYFGHMLK